MDSAESRIARLREVLELERAAERARFEDEVRTLSASEREARGRALPALVAKDTRAGFHGRTVVVFTRQDGGKLGGRIGAGDVVIVSRGEPLAPGNPRGVVVERSGTRLAVAFDDDPDDWVFDASVRLDVAGDEVTFARCRAALDEVARATGRTAQIRKVLFEDRAPAFDKERPLEPLDRSLDPTQREAVARALGARDVALIHGPPGTGKTTAVVELIRQAARRGERVLAVAPSNHATDLLVERLAAAGEDPLRIGHPARVVEAVRALTLEARLEEHPQRKLARELLEKAIAGKRRAANRRDRGRTFDDDERAARDEVKALFQDARRLESVALDHILDAARIVCATAAGAGNELLRGRRFDLVVLDEASQATTPLALVAIARGDRVVLAGDHKQLPPTVLSLDAARAGLSRTLFEELMERLPDASRLLAVQYRMNPAISAFPNARVYEGKIADHPSVATHVLEGHDPVVLWDTAGYGADERTAEGSESKENPREAELVAARVRALLAAGVAPADLAVITPYDAQAKRIRELVGLDALEVDTVDGFQGREKEVVLVSLVRSNVEGEVGFLSDVRRMNVALTRARRRLEVIGDSATVSSHEFYAAFVEHAQATGAYRSAFEVEG
jgi:superfamily I DNA and/or RNA helicase